MTRTVNLRTHTSFAQAIFVHCSHTVVIDAIHDWVTIIFIELFFLDLCDRKACNVFLREDRQGESINFIKRHA